MDSISTARDFFINQQGLNPDQADMIVSKGMEAYNQQSQPQQNMMQMASGGIARLGYQMGGSPMSVGTMPMDYGQSLQVPTQQQPMFTSTGNATSSPLLNYGQTNIGKAGGTPLTRNGYQEGGLTDFYKAEEPIIPRIENIGGLLDKAEKSIGEPQNNFASPLATTFSGFGMQSNGMQGGGIARLGYQMGGEAMMQPQMGGEMSMPQMDPQQALETIIQILIENGISPEQAQQLAQQILQIFAQGGEPAVEAFANQLEQQEQTEAMASGGIAGYGYRQGYGFGGIGKIFSGAAKAVSGVVKGVAGAVKSVAKSPIGKIALTAAAAYFAPLAFGGTTGFGAGSTYGNFFSGIMNPNLVGPLGSTAAELGRTVSSSFLSPLNIASSALNLGGDKGGLLKTLGIGGIGAALGGLLGPKKEEETDEQYQSRLQTAGPYLKEYYTNLNPGATPDQVNEFVRSNTSEYGGLGKGNTFAKGGSIVPPARQIEGGIIELDARKSGGYIPYGKKERVDDVPAMLAKDEFVFTSRAVKAAGGGSAKRGAEKMYALMKQLESKGARA